jgi:hypothetical protein
MSERAIAWCTEIPVDEVTATLTPLRRKALIGFVPSRMDCTLIPHKLIRAAIPRPTDEKVQDYLVRYGSYWREADTKYVDDFLTRADSWMVGFQVCSKS